MSPAIKKMAWHAAAWTAYTTLGITVFGYRSGFRNAVLETTLSFSVSIIIFYAHYYALKVSLGKGYILRYLIILISLLAINFLLKYFSFTVLYINVFGHKSLSIEGLSIIDLFLIFSWQNLTFFIFSAGYWFADQLLQKAKKEHKYDRLQLKMAVLKAQINPHFLFNTLDSFSTESEEVLPEMSKSIDALIEVMRYSISTPADDGLVQVVREIKAIDGLVTIFRRRFPYMHLDYIKVVPENTEYRIAPHILLPFVENAFKHGVFSDPEKRARIELQVNDSRICLQTYNKKGRNKTVHSHGIGLTYIKQQLENVYAGRYKLQITDSEDTYNVSLKIFPS